MALFIFANDINTSLESSVSSSATSITLASTTGLPTSIPSGYVLVITLNDQATRQIFEVVYATAVSGATLTVDRAQEGSPALSWGVGDYAYSGPTAGQMTALCQYPLIPHGSASFTSNGNLTVPTNVFAARVRMWGGGGGGGGAFGAGSGGSAGGGGGYCEGVISGLVPGASMAVNVGAAGSGGNGTPSGGTAGGTSSFASMSATGGGGGYGGNAGIQQSLFGAGGVGSGGSVNITGSSGGYAYAISSSVIVQGVGGGTFCTSITTAGISSQGIGGTGPGGGGNGGVVGGAGGAGAAGLVILEW